MPWAETIRLAEPDTDVALAAIVTVTDALAVICVPLGVRVTVDVFEPATVPRPVTV